MKCNFKQFTLDGKVIDRVFRCVHLGCGRIVNQLPDDLEGCLRVVKPVQIKGETIEPIEVPVVATSRVKQRRKCGGCGKKGPKVIG